MRYDRVLQGPDTARAAARIVAAMDFGDCSQVFVPLRWQARRAKSAPLIVVRVPPAPFDDDDIVQLGSFADQAVIAIQKHACSTRRRRPGTPDRHVPGAAGDRQLDHRRAAGVRHHRRARGAADRRGQRLRLPLRRSLIHIASHLRHQRRRRGPRRGSAFPMPAGDGSITAQAVRDGRVTQTADACCCRRGLQDQGPSRASGYRGVLAVPMLRDGRVIARSR